jgi:hypothetical protein
MTYPSSTPRRRRAAGLCITVDIVGVSRCPLTSNDADLSTIHKPYYYDYPRIFIQ